MSPRDPSHPPPSPTTTHPASFKPLTLVPLQDPLLSSQSYPQLPSPIRNPFFNSSYKLETHLYPSASPRTSSSLLPRASYADLPGETKTARITRQKALLHELWLLNHMGATCGGRRDSESNVLWNVVNRFVRRDIGEKHDKGGLTLFLAHANGFHKETWEPFLREMLSRAEGYGVLIHEVWAFESVQHGDSALVNDNAIGGVFDWADNARDILNFLLYHLPELPSLASLPTHLPRLPEAVSKRRYNLGYTDRTLVGIGHSLGGCSVTRAAIAYPTLFSSLVLVDPVIVPRWADPLKVNFPIPLAARAIHRRTSWPSRETALATFLSSPFFRTWHPDVLQSYVQYGLFLTPSASEDSVQLKMTGVQEAVVFIDRRVSHETWELLPQLDRGIELFFILSGKDSSAVGGDRAGKELVSRRSGNVSNVVIPSAGHLIPQEDPQELAILVADFLKRKYSHAYLKTQQKSLL